MIISNIKIGEIMGFQAPLTINTVINSLNLKYFLPAIQREFVWKEDQITSLFDSLMRGYPLGSFLFWRVDENNLQNFKFYEFIREYNGSHNQIANLKGKNEIEAILDGQQRLTTLYIGLKGSITKWVYKKYSPNGEAGNFKHKLYLNLLSLKENIDDTEDMYDFKFLVNPENTEQDFWFEIGEILNMELADIMSYVEKNSLPSISLKILSSLFSAINVNQIINYYLETAKDLHKVLNIFVRINSGGTKLDYADLMFSIASANWSKLDARDELNNTLDSINRLGEGFRISKDVILKSCLFLLDKNFKFTIDNFNNANMLSIEENWKNLSKALIKSFELIADFGFNYKTLTSNYVAAIIAYDLYKFTPEPSRDQKLLYKEFITKALLKKIFGSSLDTTMENIRKAINNGFNFNKINEMLPAGKKLNFTDEEIEEFAYFKYGQPGIFLVLSILYPNFDLSQRWHIDHIYPRAQIKPQLLINNGYRPEEASDLSKWTEYLCNLQLLEGLENIAKSDTEPEKWINDTYTRNEDIIGYKEKNYLDTNLSLEFKNFEEILEKREKTILEQLKKLLK